VASHLLIYSAFRICLLLFNWFCLFLFSSFLDWIDGVNQQFHTDEDCHSCIAMNHDHPQHSMRRGDLLFFFEVRSNIFLNFPRHYFTSVGQRVGQSFGLLWYEIPRFSYFQRQLLAFLFSLINITRSYLNLPYHLVRVLYKYCLR
jgi:hypothetical protein